MSNVIGEKKSEIQKGTWGATIGLIIAGILNPLQGVYLLIRWLTGGYKCRNCGKRMSVPAWWERRPSYGPTMCDQCQKADKDRSDKSISYLGDEVIAAGYGRVLTEWRLPLRPLSTLPYPKEAIRQALKNLLLHSQDSEYRQALQTGLLVLDDFIPDEEVPMDKGENTRKWWEVRCKLHDGPENAGSPHG